MYFHFTQDHSHVSLVYRLYFAHASTKQLKNSKGGGSVHNPTLLLLHCDDCACAVVLRSVVLCFAIIISLLLLIIDGNYSDWVCTAAMSNDAMKDLRG